VQVNENNPNLMLFDDIYNQYYKYCNNASLKIIVSKQYFEKYLNFKYAEFIVYDKFIELDKLQL
jgi:hypothetical protein